VADGLPRPDFRISTRTRARAEWTDFISRPLGWGVTLAVGVVSAIGAYLLVPDWSNPTRYIVTVISGAMGSAFFAAVLYLCLYLISPKYQRDEARVRLHDMQEARRSYDIVPGVPISDPVGTSGHIYFPIKNEGRGGRLAVMIEGIDGLPKDTFKDEHARLYWADRPEADADEMSPGDGRRIGIGVVGASAGGWRFTPMGADGPRGTARNYLIAQPGETTIWVRVVARGDPGLYYARKFGVLIKCPGMPGSEYFIERAPDPPDSVTRRTFPRLERLFEYDA
jgi:uncharacterized membrane protein YeaQ/YmgE (transglycosylase-associated protein family)